MNALADAALKNCPGARFNRETLVSKPIIDQLLQTKQPIDPEILIKSTLLQQKDMSFIYKNSKFELYTRDLLSTAKISNSQWSQFKNFYYYID